MSNLKNITKKESEVLDAMIPVSLDTIKEQVAEDHSLRVSKFNHQLTLAATAKKVKDWFDETGQAELAEKKIKWGVAELSEKVFRFSAKGKFLPKLVRAAKMIEDGVDPADFIKDAEANDKSLSINVFLKWNKDEQSFPAKEEEEDAEEEVKDTQATAGKDTAVTFSWKGLTLKNGEQDNLALRVEGDGTVHSNLSVADVIDALEILKGTIQEAVATEKFL